MFVTDDFYQYSAPEIVNRLGRIYKDYRMRANLTQKEVADKTGLTITTIHKFENGISNNISFNSFILLLKSVCRINAIADVLPELPESPYLIKKDKKVQRIRHPKKKKE